MQLQTHRPSAVHSPETDPPLATKEQNPLQILSPHFTRQEGPASLSLHPHSSLLSPCPLQVIHFSFWMSLFLSRGWYVPHKPTVRPLLIERTSVGVGCGLGGVGGVKGFVIVRTPPCWFPSKQQPKLERAAGGRCTPQERLIGETWE